MTVGERIKAIRKEKGMTQKQVADGCGMADSAIRKYESGLITPKLETLQRISDALCVHIFDLLGIGDELDSYDGKFTVSPDTPENRAFASFLNSSGIRDLYNTLSDLEREELLTKSGLITVSEQSQATHSPESEIVEKIKSVYGEAVSDTFSMYVMLDAGDRGEIRGEIKQMLKQGKYLKQEGNLA